MSITDLFAHGGILHFDEVDPRPAYRRTSCVHDKPVIQFEEWFAPAPVYIKGWGFDVVMPGKLQFDEGKCDRCHDPLGDRLGEDPYTGYPRSETIQPWVIVGWAETHFYCENCAWEVEDLGAPLVLPEF